MFTATTMERSHMLPTSGTNSLKDMALALVLGLVNISPLPPSPLFDDTIQRMPFTFLCGGCYK